MTHADVLDALIDWRLGLDELAQRLKGWPYDVDGGTLVVLQTGHMRRALHRYLAGDVTPAEVERRADLIVQRPGIEYAAGEEEVLEHALFTLSTPDINGELTQFKATSMLRQLRARAL